MSSRMLRGLGVGVAMAALALAIVAAPATAATGTVRWVDDDAGASGGPAACATAAYTTIQGAIDASNAWDTIKVCPGTYPEQVVLTKRGLLVQSARLHAAHIVAPATLVPFDGETALVTLTSWADRLVGFDIGIDSGDLPATAARTNVITDGICSHVDAAVLSLDGRQQINRNVIHPIGPYSLSGACGYDYGIVFGLSAPVASTNGTVLTGSDVSRAKQNKIKDFRFGGILAEGPDVKVHIDHNRLLFLHTQDPSCSVPLGSSPDACIFSTPNRMNPSSVHQLLSGTSRITGATPNQVNSQFVATFGIGAEGGAAVDVAYNNIHSGLNFGGESNSILAVGVWLIGADGTSRIFNNIVTNTFIGIGTGAGFGPGAAAAALPAVATDGTDISRNQTLNNYLGIGIDDDANNITQNTVTSNFIGGVEVEGASNLIHGNNFAFNYNIAGYDCQDTTTGGTGTDGTDNTWTNNLGVTSSPDGLCTSPILP